jgi:hypothetical protein
MAFFTGSPEVRERVSTLLPEQQGLYKQAVKAGMGQGAGGAFGTAADYYRNLLSDNPADMQAFAAPEMRRFNEQIIPGIAEQFAGMGAGGLSSSGFQNASVSAGTDLSERLAALRAGLRQSGAQGLQNIGQTGLQNYSETMTTQPGTEGFLSQIAPAAGTAIGSFAGPAGSAIGNLAGNWLSSSLKGKSSPYGKMPGAPSSSNGFNLPNFMQR